MAAPVTGLRLAARVHLLGERLDTAGLERSDLISKIPLAFRVGEGGSAVLFRYGVVVLIGLTPVAEDEVLRGLRPRVHGPFSIVDTESATIEILPGEDQVASGGPIAVRELDPPRLLVIADVLAKNVALGRDEREVSKVFETIEPFAAALARSGRSPSNRRSMLRTIGQALLVHHRMSGRIEIEEKPDVLWDNPQLERLYARLALAREVDCARGGGSGCYGRATPHQTTGMPHARSFIRQSPVLRCVRHRGRLAHVGRA